MSSELIILFFFWQAGDYVWLTYEEVYNIVINLGAAIRYVGVQPVSSVATWAASPVFRSILN